ncbi:MAG: nuclear transport factor 2 family protein [Proteobacteria bacterium]|nr:nuclear transport factor 2 family protein [Pseudomonadota bacterium]
MNHTTLAKALFDAFMEGDGDAVRALCASDMSAIQNAGPPMTVDSLIAFALSVKRVIPDFRYEQIQRRSTNDGFVEEHSVRGTLPDGTMLDIAACVVAEVRDGKLIHMREYLDTAAAKGLIRVLSGSR